MGQQHQCILVTGGAGFIGSFVVDALIARGQDVIVYDNLDPQPHPHGPPEYLNPKAEFIHADVRDSQKLLLAVLRADAVIHLAAAVGMGQSMYQVNHYIDVNTRGTAVLLDILANEKPRHRVSKVIVAASMSSYGEGAYRCPVRGPVQVSWRREVDMAAGIWEHRSSYCEHFLLPFPTPETWPQQGGAIYAQSKAHQEHTTLSVCGAYDIPAVALRFFNVYGPRQSLSNPYTGVAAIFLSRLKNNRPPVIYEDGGQTRDFISVHDVARGILMALDSETGFGASYNLGGGHPLAIVEVARLLAHLLGKDLEPEITGHYRKGDIRHCGADMQRMRMVFGFTPQISFEDGMRELITWSQGVEAKDGFEQARAELTTRGLA